MSHQDDAAQIADWTAKNRHDGYFRPINTINESAPVLFLGSSVQSVSISNEERHGEPRKIV